MNYDSLVKKGGINELQNGNDQNVDGIEAKIDEKTFKLSKGVHYFPSAEEMRK